MSSTLDDRFEAAYNKVIGENGLIKVGTIERYGRELPFISNAPQTLTDYIGYFCAQHGAADFLVGSLADGGEERLSFQQYYAAARQVAIALVEDYGVQRGDRVGIAMRNCNSWCVLFAGILLAGGCATLLNIWWETPELADAMEDTDVKLVISDLRRGQRLADCTGKDVQLVALDTGQPFAEAFAPLLAKRTAADGSPREATQSLPQLTGDDLATIVFTSGSTGRSKGAYSKHISVVQGTFNYVTQGLALAALLTEAGIALPKQTSLIVCVPLCHITGLVPVFLQSFALGRKLPIMYRWDAEEAMRIIERERITAFTGVPLMSYEILTHPNRDKYDLSSCLSYAAGGAPRPPEHVKRLAQDMGGAMPALGYGLTETNAVGCGNLNESYLAKPMSTGKASPPLVDLAILDDDGKPLAQGEIGEVSIRSIATIEGYWENEQATKEAITEDGYFRTGDLGYLDEDGYLFIVDRKKDIVIRGGENISCIEVEAGLYELPDVKECSAFGLPDERFGEILGAVVWLKEGSDLDEHAIQAALVGKLASFKIPAHIWISPEALPRAITEKIDKKRLRAHYQKLHAARN